MKKIDENEVLLEKIENLQHDLVVRYMKACLERRNFKWSEDVDESGKYQRICDKISILEDKIESLIDLIQKLDNGEI